MRLASANKTIEELEKKAQCLVNLPIPDFTFIAKNGIRFHFLHIFTKMELA